MAKRAKKVSRAKKSSPAKRAKPAPKPPSPASPFTQLQHLELAEEFFQAFRDLPPNGPSGIPVNWPRYFALCHAIELALRAFLLARGKPDRQLRDIVLRHNISNLMAEAIQLGLTISPQVRSDIDLLSEAHKNFWPRYPRETGNSVYIVSQFEKPFVELLTAVAVAIRGGNRRQWVKY
jgi:hypothetical protein